MNERTKLPHDTDAAKAALKAKLQAMILGDDRLTLAACIDAFAEYNTGYEAAIIAQAQAQAGDKLRVDNATIAEPGDIEVDGGWVLAWVWVDLPAPYAGDEEAGA